LNHIAVTALQYAKQHTLPHPHLRQYLPLVFGNKKKPFTTGANGVPLFTITSLQMAGTGTTPISGRPQLVELPSSQVIPTGLPLP
jgi:hypothetical protein